MLRDLARVPDDDNFRYYFTVAPPYLDRNEESLVYNNAADAKSSAKTKRFISSTEVIFSNFQPNIWVLASLKELTLRFNHHA